VTSPRPVLCQAVVIADRGVRNLRNLGEASEGDVNETPIRAPSQAYSHTAVVLPISRQERAVTAACSQQSGNRFGLGSTLCRGEPMAAPWGSCGRPEIGVSYCQRSDCFRPDWQITYHLNRGRYGQRL